MNEDKKIKDWFADKEEFEEELKAAQERDDGDEFQLFLENLEERYKKYGMEAFLSIRQFNWMVGVGR